MSVLTSIDDNSANLFAMLIHPPLRPLQARSLPIVLVPNNKEEESYKCGICLSYLEYPVGCGHCLNRFCRKCLEKAKQRQQAVANATGSNSNNNDPNQDSNQDQNNKCPCCRQNFELVVPDIELQARMVAEVITCPNVGCGMSISRAKMRSHYEKECHYVKMKCKYAKFGCKWTGLRADVSVHTEYQCNFGEMNGLIEKHRQLSHSRAKQAGQMHFLIKQLNESTQLIHSQQLELERTRSQRRRRLRNLNEEAIIQHISYVLKILENIRKRSRASGVSILADIIKALVASSLFVSVSVDNITNFL